jgi:hypothetical protein
MRARAVAGTAAVALSRVLLKAYLEERNLLPVSRLLELDEAALHLAEPLDQQLERAAARRAQLCQTRARRQVGEESQDTGPEAARA